MVEWGGSGGAVNVITKVFVIRKTGNGYYIEACVNGTFFYCGADRKWRRDEYRIGPLFRTLAGTEWYVSEWVLE